MKLVWLLVALCAMIYGLYCGDWVLVVLAAWWLGECLCCWNRPCRGFIEITFRWRR